MGVGFRYGGRATVYTGISDRGMRALCRTRVCARAREKEKEKEISPLFLASVIAVCAIKYDIFMIILRFLRKTESYVCNQYLLSHS